MTAPLNLEWLPNVEPDVVGYRLQYRADDDPRWTQSPTMSPAGARAGTISGLEAGRQYVVSIVAVDDAGNASVASPTLSGAPLPRAGAAPQLRRARYEARAQRVRLEWDAPNAGVVELLVLRREEGGTFRVIGSATAGTTNFADGTVRPGRQYEYALRARDRSGELTDSRSRSVTIPEAPR